MITVPLTQAVHNEQVAAWLDAEASRIAAECGVYTFQIFTRCKTQAVARARALLAFSIKRHLVFGDVRRRKKETDPRVIVLRHRDDLTDDAYIWQELSYKLVANLLGLNHSTLVLARKRYAAEIFSHDIRRVAPLGLLPVDTPEVVREEPSPRPKRKPRAAVRKPRTRNGTAKDLLGEDDYMERVRMARRLGVA